MHFLLHPISLNNLLSFNNLTNHVIPTLSAAKTEGPYDNQELCCCIEERLASILKLQRHSRRTCSYNIRVDFTLRKLRPGDFEVLWAIDQKCFPPGISYSRQELSAYIRRWSAFTVVADEATPKESAIRNSSPKNHSLKNMSRQNGLIRDASLQSQILGFIVAEMGRHNEGHIITIDVLPEVRQQGIGTKLLAAAEDRLREAKCDTVILEAAVDNKAALAFYDRHKYFAFKTLAHYYPNGVNAYVLRKDLLSEARAS